MNVKALLTDDDAVSPVIGVILMVAITVILAAVIGTFVLGLQDRVGPAGPSASFSWELDNGGDGTWSDTNNNITITHDTGDKLDVETIEIKVGDDTLNPTATTWAEDVTAGDSQQIADTGINDPNPTVLNATTGIAEGDSIRVIWNSPEGDSTQTIGENEVS